jgi:hypothetical protein
MACRSQLFRQIAVVINLAVKNNHYTAVFIEKRLLTAGYIHDGQAAMPQAQSRFKINFPFIRPAVLLGLIHSHKQFPIDFTFPAHV